MADWTAITAIVVSGAVGPSLTAWWAQRRLRREHENARVLADRQDVRALLDAATEELSRAGRLTGALESLIFTHGPAIGVHATTHFEHLGEALRAVDLNDGRFALRLGPEHPTSAAHHRAFRGLISASDGGFEVRQLGPQAEASDIRGGLAKIREGMGEYRDAHAEYMAAAHTVAASQLEPSSGWRLKRSRRARTDGGRSLAPTSGEPLAVRLPDDQPPDAR